MNLHSSMRLAARRMALAAAGLLLSGSLSAQVPFAGGTISGTIDAGGRAFTDKPAATEWARFGEYRNFHDGAYLPNARLRFNADDRFFIDVRAFDVGRSDQQFFLNAYRPGRFSLDISWNQIPHLYSTTSQLYGGDPATPNVFSLPALRPTVTQLNASPLLSEVASQWDVGRVAFKAQATPSWDVKAEYTRTRKEGRRPIGMAFGSPGNNFREILEPIDQTTHAVRLSQGLGNAQYRAEIGYDFSIFQNEYLWLEADNPGAATFTTGGAPATGRTALAPDNLAHMFSFLASASKLPGRTRVTATATYSWLLQDDAMLGYTINPTLAAPAGPASLNGDQRTLNLVLSATTRPIRDINLSARYRRYQLDDRTPHFEVPLDVVNDRTLATGPFEREYHSFERDMARLEAGWRSALPVSLSASIDYNRWRRHEAREAPLTQEYAPRAVLNLDLTSWLGLRAGYTHSWRRYTSYTPVLAVELPQLRRFDQADRDRNKIDLSAEFTPIAPLGFTATFTRSRNDYLVGNNPAPGYGVQGEWNNAVGGDASYTLNDRVNVWGSATYEWLRMQQRSRYRETPTMLDNLTYDWIGSTKDRIYTAGAGFELTLFPEKLVVGSAWNFYDARTDILAWNLTTPTGGTATQNANATAVDMPSVTRTLHRLQGSLQYRVAVNWSATVSYAYQRFTDSDFRTDGLIPAPPAPAAQGDVFLGSDVLGYRASYVALTLGYHIGMSPRALRLDR